MKDFSHIDFFCKLAADKDTKLKERLLGLTHLKIRPKIIINFCQHLRMITFRINLCRRNWALDGLSHGLRNGTYPFFLCSVDKKRMLNEKKKSYGKEGSINRCG